MKIILHYSILTTLFITICGCLGQNQAEVDAAAQQLFEQNLDEIKIAADEACLKKRADYVTMYKDSLSHNHKIGDE